jgi:ParB-like chromosome segregation protein Spo0J
MATKADKDKLAAGAAAIKQAAKEGKPTASAMEIHPIAKMFPSIPAKEMRELKGDIEAHGISVPILVNRAKDTIIDGRNRYMIAMELGLDLTDAKQVPMEIFKGTDEEIPQVILSRNIFRRHLNNDQRVALVTKIRLPQLEAEAKDRMAKKGTFGAKASPDGKKGSVAAHIAKEAEVSTHKAEQAVKAAKAGQLGDVIAKKKSLKQAAASAPSKPKKAKAEKSFEDKVLEKWDRFMKAFAPQQRRQVREVIYGFLIEELKPTAK